MFKKALCTTIALMLFVATIPVQAQQANVLSDITLDSDYFISVNHLYANGVIGGYPDGTFKPNNTINRAELMKVLVESTSGGIDESKYQNCFPDVRQDWYAKYVCYAKEQNWVEGYPDGRFRPDKAVQRSEAIKMIVNAFNVKSTVYWPLPDDVNREDWFGEFVETGIEYGVLELNDNRFEPAENATRGYVSDILYKLITVFDNDLYSFKEYTVEGPYKVTKVIDGDTLDVDTGDGTARVRLIGIDAPEVNGSSEEEGRVAKLQVENDLLEEYVLLESDYTQSNTDIYDRNLRYVRLLDGTNYNLRLVEQGYAYEYTYLSNPYIYKSSFDQAEENAISSNLGLWSSDITTTSSTIEYEETSNLKDIINSDNDDLVAKIEVESGVTLGTTPLKVTFNGSKSFDRNSEDVDFYWDFNNGMTSELENPDPVIFDEPGEYQVILTITNDKGEIDQDEIKITTIEEDPYSDFDYSHTFYVSSEAKSKYYCDTDSAWKNLSQANLREYSSETSLRIDFPNLVLNKPC